jgi:opacity protein-like surface antigen
MKRISLLILCFIFTLSSFSQAWKYKRFEVWAGVSDFQYYGDVGGSPDKSNMFGLKDISFKSQRPGINIGFSYRLEERLYVHATNSFGIFSQTDQGSRNSVRNFAFSSMADELSVQGVFYLIKERNVYYYSIMARRGGLRKLNQPLSLYTFVGVGGLFFKVIPKDNLDGSSRFIGNKHVSASFPVGLGLKFAYNQNISFGMELGARLTLTDYLDGLTSQYSKHNDIYYILNFKLIYRLSKGKGLKQIFKMKF